MRFGQLINELGVLLSTNATQVQVRNMHYVVAVGPDKQLRGEAKREKAGAPWIISTIHGGILSALVVARVEACSSEVLQRKLVQAILKEL